MSVIHRLRARRTSGGLEKRGTVAPYFFSMAIGPHGFHKGQFAEGSFLSDLALQQYPYTAWHRHRLSLPRRALPRTHAPPPV